MKQIPDLTPEERVKYAQELEFINNQVEESKQLLSVSKEIQTSIEIVHSKCLSIHKAVDTHAKQYNQLESAIAKFQNCIKDIEELNTDTNNAWAKLSEVENKLKQKANPPKDKTQPTEEPNKTD